MTPVLTTDHPIAQCIDLRATFAGQFRFGWDEAYAAERPDRRRVEAPWLTIIRCRSGRIFPWGGRLLAAYSSRRRHALANLLAVTSVQGGTAGRFSAGEVIVTFEVSHIEAVAACLGAYRPRQLSPEERERRATCLQVVRKRSEEQHISQPGATNAGEPLDQVVSGQMRRPARPKHLILRSDGRSGSSSARLRN
jgi:hypothetical protein